METSIFTIELAQRAGYCFEAGMEPLRAVATVAVRRNAQNRLRIGRIGVNLRLARPVSGSEPLRRVLDQFEDFCIVTQSVRAGIPIDVRVIDRSGAVLNQPETTGEPA